MAGSSAIDHPLRGDRIRRPGRAGPGRIHRSGPASVRPSGALRLAEDLRRSVEQLHGQRADSAAGALGMTISIGVCSLTPADALDALAAIELADQALYLAKQNGRNRVQLTGAGGLSTSDPAPVASAQ